MKQNFCQSCGMPLTDDVLGTNGRSSESHPSLLEDGRVASDEGKANEKEKQMPIREPDLLIILTGGQMAYTRPDGVKIIPLGCLKD